MNITFENTSFKYIERKILDNVSFSITDTDKIGVDGYPIQEYTIHISKPIYPDPNKSKIDNVKYIMDENFRIWKDIYESVYHVKLQYTTQEARA
jgi:hypothetical protein